MSALRKVTDLVTMAVTCLFCIPRSFAWPRGLKTRHASPRVVHHRAIRRRPLLLTSSHQVPMSTEVHHVTWQTATGNLTFDAYHGETLRTAALRRGFVSPHNGRANLINCRGLGTCGTCAVAVTGEVKPADWNTGTLGKLSLFVSQNDII